jgi:hypothetical protein
VPPELDVLCTAALDTSSALRPTARALGEGIQQYLDGDRDLALRRSLARTHHEHAIVAFAANDRSKAMREAGRALALDPTLHPAGELITRMMLEPPKILPPEVKKAFDSESADVVRRSSTAAAIASGMYLVFVPLLAIFGHASPLWLLALGLVSGSAVLMLLWMRKPGKRFVAAPVILANLVLLFMVSWLYSPLLLGPALAVCTATGFMTGPQYAKRQASWVVGLVTLAALGPLLLEGLGTLTSSMTVFDGGVTFHSPMIYSGPSFLILLIAYTVTVIISAVVLLRGMRLAERNARQHMHLQAWQLRQLVAQSAD